MLSVLNQRSHTHNSCEDSVYTKETESEIYGIIADGCSTGIKSHFASQAICYSFAHKLSIHEGYLSVIGDRFMHMMAYDLDLIRSTLGLDEMNFLSTMILFHYNKNRKELGIRVLGDGYYYINDVEYVVDQNNTPDYFGYYMRNTVARHTFLEKYPEWVYSNVDKFIISSDGIKSIERTSLQEDAKVDPMALLLHPPTSKNYLDRMWNLIKRDKFILSDDLTIVSYG